MVTATNLGIPRIGAHRELKRATEAYWAGGIQRDELLETAAALRKTHWQMQRDAGIDHIPSNDFSFYDRVLDTAAVARGRASRHGRRGSRHGSGSRPWACIASKS